MTGTTVSISLCLLSAVLQKQDQNARSGLLVLDDVYSTVRSANTCIPAFASCHSYAVDLVVCAALGVDMFDCVFPTRTAVCVSSCAPRGVDMSWFAEKHWLLRCAFCFPLWGLKKFVFRAHCNRDSGRRWSHPAPSA